MFSVLRKGMVVPSKSFARRAMSDAFVFKGVATSDIAEASFRVAEGSKVSLMGSNETAKSDIIKLLNGELSASSGIVTLPATQNIVRFQPTIPKESHIYTVKSFLEQSMNPEDLKNSSAVVAKILENVKLGARLERRTINTLSSSQHARLQFAVSLLQVPDVLLLDQPTVTSSGPLSHDDVQDLTDFVMRFPKTCVVNSIDEDFLNSFTDTVLSVDSTGNVEKLTSSYAAAKDVIENRARSAVSEAMEEKFRAKPAQDDNFTYAKFAAAEAELDALNEIGFANTKTSDEEYVRLMMILMVLHPPLVYALYHAGVFDAIL
jgi:ATPase subunit of ABC transporter with duplicated ATPase domains